MEPKIKETRLPFTRWWSYFFAEMRVIGHRRGKLPSITKFRAALREMNRKIFYEFILEQGGVFVMPYGMGEMFVAKRKRDVKFHEDGSINKRSLMADFPRSKALWKEMYGDDPDEWKKHTDKPLVYLERDYYYPVWWSKRRARVKNKRMFKFYPAQQYSLALKRLVNGNKINPERLYNEV